MNSLYNENDTFPLVFLPKTNNLSLTMKNHQTHKVRVLQATKTVKLIKNKQHLRNHHS